MQLGIDPCKKLLAKFTSYSSVKLQIDTGKVLFKALPYITKDSSSKSSPIDGGITPEKLLWDRSNPRNFVKLPNTSGMDPESLGLWRISNFSKNRKLPISSGRVPVKFWEGRMIDLICGLSPTVHSMPYQPGSQGFASGVKAQGNPLMGPTSTGHVQLSPSVAL